MKRIHILQHVPYENPGCIKNWIKEKSYNSSVTELCLGETPPPVSDIDWLIIMGGPMSVHDVDEFPWLVDEKIYVKEAVDSGKVVIGICLGSQLIAEALGSRVYRNKVSEIGWFPVTKTVPGLNLPLLEKFNETEIVFHWHGDTFDIPEGAVHGAVSDACMNQCFVYNDRVAGLQFHVEVTEELLDMMVKNGINELVPGRFIQNMDILKSGEIFIKRNNELMFSILDELDRL